MSDEASPPSEPSRPVRDATAGAAEPSVPSAGARARARRLRRTRRDRFLTAVVSVVIITGCVLIGYSLGSAFREQTLTQTANIYATSFNNSGISSFPNFPSISSAGPSAPAPPYIDGFGSSNALVTAISTTVTTTQAADLMVLLVNTDGQATGFTSGVTISGTWDLTWTLESSLEYRDNGGGSPYWLYVFYASAGTNVGADTITVAFPAPYTVTTATLTALAIKNVAATTWDGTPVETATQLTGAGATLSITTTNAHDFLLSFLGMNDQEAITKTATFTTIATLDSSDGRFLSYSEYEAVAAVGTYTSHPTWTGNHDYGMILGAIEGTTATPSLDATGTSVTLVDAVSAEVTASEGPSLIVLMLGTDTQATGFTTGADISSTWGLSFSLESSLEYCAAGGQCPSWTYLFYASVSGMTGAQTVTVTFPAPYTVAGVTMTVLAVANAAAVPWDGTPAKVSGTANTAIASITTTNPNDLVLSSLVAAANALTFTSTPAFTAIVTLVSSDAHFTAHSEFARVTSTGTYTSSPTWGGGADAYGMIVGAIEGAGPIETGSPFLDAWASTTNAAGNPASLAVTLTTSQSNDLLVLLLGTATQTTAQTASSISDLWGLSWTLKGAALEFITAGGTSPAWLYVFYAPAGNHVGTDTITASFANNAAAAATEIALAVADVATSPWDGNLVTTTGTAATATASITTTNANDFIFSSLGVETNEAITGPPAFSTIASQDSQGNDFTAYSEYTRVTAAGATTYTPTWPTAEPYGMILGAIVGGSAYHPPAPKNPQVCTNKLYLPGGSGPQSPSPAFVNATGPGNICYASGQQYMFLEWQLEANQTTRAIPALTYFLNFSFAWLPYNSKVVHTWGLSLPLVVNSTQTDGPTLVIYLMFGTLPYGPPLGTVLPVILEVAATLAK